MKSAEQIRVRFAPSPTGPLHLGGVRTALYNFLFARKHNGTMILRIEDTDQTRFVPGAEQYIIESLQWCGICFDEGVVQGGPHGPYRQSERSAIYRNYIQQLLDKGHAYYAFDTPDELEEARKQVSSSGTGQFQYNYITRKEMKNSLNLSAETVKALLEQGVPYVIRIRIPENDIVVFNDLIRGEVKVHTSNLDDKVLFKSDGLPTYHLANVVDDYLMEISHVIRGEEWLPSAPMHLLLYRFFGWESEMPQFAHLPLILKPDGHGKLSKRDGDRLGFPVFPLEWRDSATGEVYHGYREDGYLPDAFINMLALLGWNPGTEDEIFSMEQLTDLFSLERVGKSGSKFDPEKARWFNHQYICSQSTGALAPHLEKELESRSIVAKRDYVERVIALTRERATLLGDLWSQSWFFFQAPDKYDPQVKAKIWNDATTALVKAFMADVQALDPFNEETLHLLVAAFTASHQVKTGMLMNPLRLLTVGSSQGPGMMDLAATLGKEEFISRIGKGLTAIG